MTITEHIRDHIFKTAYKVDSNSYHRMKISEWSTEFETLMRNRLIIGALRYGKLHAKGKPQYDRLGRILDAIKLYQEDGNNEHLVDIANMALLEYEEGAHPKKHFSASDDKLHTRRIK